MEQALGSADCVTLACAGFGAVDFIATELLLFAGAWFLVGALDDLALDGVWLWQRFIRKARHPDPDLPIFVPPQLQPMSAQACGPPRHAVFIPAWDEADVIGEMIGHCLLRWAGQDYRLYVGVYANDAATSEAAERGARGDSRVRIVLLDIAGPSSKADCLNHIWQAMERDEQQLGFRYVSVVLHDAEDVVHPCELQVYDQLLGRHAFVQLPVSPLVHPASPLISGHYADEFAEAHARAMPVRSRLGVAMPCAGVGCGFARTMLQALADASHEDRGPFASDSLTEDYELGIRIHEAGGRGRFVRLRDAAGDLVATRAYFPADLSASVRQKTRWTIGIALAGWDRTGWGRGVADIWMRARDRRSTLSALVLLAAYLGLSGWLVVSAGAVAGLYRPDPLDPAFRALMLVNGLVLAWRVAVRALCTGRQYGFGQALWSVPRVLVGNIIAVMAARRALLAYAASLRGGRLAWDKTRHQIPALPPAPSPAGRTAVRPQ